jgi:voltage-gated potassium channel
MTSDRLFTLVKTNMNIITLLVLVLSIIIFGGIAVYLAEHGHRGANITNIGDAFWWTIVTITTVGYGEYYPVTTAGRIIATFIMLSGIGIFALLVSAFAQRRFQRTEARLKSMIKPQASLLVDETKTAIKSKIEVIEKLTDEDFDILVVMLKSLRRTLLEESKISSNCSGCGIAYHNKPKFCSNCGLDLTGSIVKP